MDQAESLNRLVGVPRGHLATIRSDGRPHVVVVVFTLVGESVVTAIDHKPKTTHRLQRLANIEANPSVSFLVDHYDANWEHLWWVRVDGQASIHLNDQVAADGRTALAVKYHQYGSQPPAGPVISITLDDISSWESTP